VRRVRLSDMDAQGRIRFDAIARFLQDTAIEDVEETGWGLPEHVWFIRSIRIDVLAPLVLQRRVRLLTWCSALGTTAAGRRWSLEGDRGGRIEVDSTWIHLGPDERPARLEGFDVYAEATDGRKVTTKLELPVPPLDGPRIPWPLRQTDVDLHGHVNNAAYWQAVEERLAVGGLGPGRPIRALLDYRHPIDVGDEVALVEVASAEQLDLGFVVGSAVNAVARVSRIR
jgi:acyl-ACP thioesterase